MVSIEPNSPGCTTCSERTERGNARRTRHAAGEVLCRHRHDDPFAAVVLSGGYVESGDTGRHRVVAGDVIIHRRYESHLDRFDGPAEVLVLPLSDPCDDILLGHVEDVDAVVRIAERDVRDAIEALRGGLIRRVPTMVDWPDILAADLIATPAVSLRQWAVDQGLHPGSLGRGFRQEFGMTPASFRTTAMARRALHELESSSTPLCHVAAKAGFADQAHMTRTVGKLTGRRPRALRPGALAPSK